MVVGPSVSLLACTKRKTKNQLKIYKNEIMIMREKHMRKKFGNMRK